MHGRNTSRTKMIFLLNIVFLTALVSFSVCNSFLTEKIVSTLRVFLVNRRVVSCIADM